MAIRALEPFLNVLLFVGERLSRLMEHDDPDYLPARMPGEGGAAPRGLGARARGGDPVGERSRAQG